MAFLGIGGGKSYDNPADSAMPYLQEIPETVTPYYQPYIEQGLQSGQILGEQYGQMATNPQGYYDSIMSEIHFVDALHNNYRLLSSSPAIDYGINLTNYGIIFDFDNYPRPAGNSFDVGAFEYH